MTPRRQAQVEAALVLLEAGWSAERIGLVLGISRASVDRLIPAPPAPTTPAHLPGCCHIDPLGYYCDIPTLWPGEVYCDTHRRLVWPS